MKTLSKILTIGLIICLFSACAIFRRKTVAEALEATTQVASRTSATFDYGVVINGVRWATRNVDMPGTFAQNPEDAGMFFQWNRKKGWNATDERIKDWDNSRIEGTEWYAENDPCPEGWRVPTREELQSLYDTGGEWTTQNGVYGYLWGVAPHQIFLPAAGWRFGSSSALGSAGTGGQYWGSTLTGPITAIRLLFGNNINVEGNYRALGFSVRCVKIK